MAYVIAIPSYNRSDVCNSKTLKALQDNHIKKSQIYVFVVKEEENEYLTKLDSSRYGKLIVGKSGLCAQKTFIENYFDKFEAIIYIDDDITHFDLSESDIFKTKSLDYFFRAAFQICIEAKSYIWGVYPCYNSYFRRNRKELSTDLNFLIGGLHGVINRPHNKCLKYTITNNYGSSKEDVEKSIKYYKYDGIVLRFNRIAYASKICQSGGLGNMHTRLENEKNASLHLKREYPDMGEVSVKKDGWHDFKIALSKIKLHTKSTKRSIRSSRQKKKTHVRKKR